VTAWKCIKTLSWTLVTKELAVALRQHAILHQAIFDWKHITVIPTHSSHLTWPVSIFLCFHDSRYHNFDKIEMIEAELQVPLNTQNMTFRIYFKKGQKHWERYICTDGD
jgi:hypothetical protein